MSNTYNSALVVDTLRDAPITSLQPLLAAFRSFSTLFEGSTQIPDSVLRVPLVTAGSTTQTNPTSFGGGDSTVGVVSVTLAHLEQPFHISHADAKDGLRLETLAKVNLAALANKMMDTVLAPLTEANYGAAEVVAPASFDWNDAITMRVAVKNALRPALVLDGSAGFRLLPQNKEAFSLADATMAGWPGGIHINNRWPGTDDVYGFACDPQALAIGAAVPPELPGNYYEVLESVILPDLGLTIRSSVFYDQTTRNWNGSYDLMLGAAKADTTALKLIASA